MDPHSRGSWDPSTPTQHSLSVSLSGREHGTAVRPSELHSRTIKAQSFKEVPLAGLPEC